jgi:endoglucanase
MNPDGQHDRFVSIWRQVAPLFKDYPDSLVFEILNEPNTNLTMGKWNALLRETLDTIRHSNPKRVRDGWHR